jgi:hypothetical protein
MIIDTHVHIGRLHDSPYEKMTHEEVRDVLVREMKRVGVAHAIVLPFFTKKSGASVETSLTHTLELVEGHPMLHAIGTLDMIAYSKKDLQFLEQLLKAKTISGIKLYPGYQHIYPTDTRCFPIYALCEKYSVPVIFHSGDTLSMPGRVAKVKYSHPLHLDEVATDHPKLTIIMAHLGNPWFVDAAEVLYKNPNVYADISGLVVGASLKTSYGRLMKQRIEELMAYASPQKLLYGSDWPLTSMKPYIEFAKSLTMSRGDREMVFYKNAARLFQISL